MSARTPPSPQVSLIQLRAQIAAGAAISTAEAARLTEIVRGAFEGWSDPAESAIELTILLLQGKLEPWQQTYALDLLDGIEKALQQKTDGHNRV